MVQGTTTPSLASAAHLHASLSAGSHVCLTVCLAVSRLLAANLVIGLRPNSSLIHPLSSAMLQLADSGECGQAAPGQGLGRAREGSGEGLPLSLL